jgi:hypothetical protein
VPTDPGSAADGAIDTAPANAHAAPSDTSAFGRFIASILACIVDNHNWALENCRRNLTGVHRQPCHSGGVVDYARPIVAGNLRFLQ